MANDAKLEQLKIAQDQAYKNKQSSYQEQQNSWDNLSKAKDKMNRLHEIKQAAFNDQERSWQEYQSVRNRNSPRIDQLNSAQEIAYANMKNAFDRASAAHNSHDGASAKSYSEEGHRYQAEAKKIVEERRQLVEECRIAKSRHEPYETTFDKAKIDFGRAKDEFEKAKAVHQFRTVCFKVDKEKFDAASKAFQSRLNELKAENANKIKNKRAIAAKAGVPYQYRDDIYVSENANGTVNIYFGGAGSPDGPGHGHYALDLNGNVVYKREPWDQHGAQNYSNSKHDYFDIIMEEITKANGWEFGFNCTFRGHNAFVESDYSRDGQRKINIYYGPNGPFGKPHNHAGARIDNPLELIFDEVR